MASLNRLRNISPNAASPDNNGLEVIRAGKRFQGNTRWQAISIDRGKTGELGTRGLITL